MKQILLFLSLPLLVSCGGQIAKVRPQGWVSSGGYDLQHSVNAWWVKNTETVGYCIVSNDDVISVRRDRLSTLVYGVFQYWKREFNRKMVYVKGLEETTPDILLGIAKQKFHEVPCDGREDLKFNFGYETLDDDQRDFIDRQPKALAIAVRTSYDEENLRGRGFVFVASDKGPHHYDGGETAMDAPWRYEGLLFMILTHEMGHVFGIPHTGSLMMSAQYPELITRKSMEPIIKGANNDGKDLPAFFVPDTDFKHCNLSAEGKAFFGLDKESCLWIALDLTKKEFIVRAGETIFEFPKEAGRITDLNRKPTADMPSFFFLPPKQKVFSKIEVEGEKFSYLPGPFMYTADGTGMHVVKGQPPRPVFLNLNGNRPFSLWGLIDNKIKALINHFNGAVAGG